MRIRAATEVDMPTCEAIYTHHVHHGVSTFDETPQASGFLENKRRKLMSQNYAFLLVEEEEHVAGYAYVAPFRERSAYRFAGEGSIYLDPDYTGRGLAKFLLDELIRHSRAQGLRSLIAVMGMDQDQEVTIHPSVRAHAKVGFKPAGCMDFVGYKFDRWLKTAYMRLDLGECSR